MNTAEIRKNFLDYFAAKDHELVVSSSLVPANDPTLLFTNAGMVQFKDVFLGQESCAYVRAASSQRCVRAGGKHNDLENVGYTARHHTFFEMLGNFSFGDYFKRDAIHYAWQYLTEVVGLSPEKLWVTVYEEDDDAADIWLNDIAVDPARFSRIGAKDNFWSMGDTGPCGPCSEIFYDHGPDIAGGPPGTPEEDGDRYIEIWNLVFMQYDRNAKGELKPLPKPSVDTGMGLERLAAILQGVHNNYDIDLFKALIKATAELAKVDDLSNNSLRVIADHIRACAFLITDGVVPSNEGRGYVLRRIIRRAIRHGYQLGLKEVFFYKLVKPLVVEMGEAYPELLKAQGHVERMLCQEEERFAETIEQGMGILEQAIKKMSGKTIPGETVFKLYDTYGFPVDLTADIARERGLKLDKKGFDKSMAEQRERARAASHFSLELSDGIEIDAHTDFIGYTQLEEKCQVIALYANGKPVNTLQEGQDGLVVLDKTPFYAESGGQVGDQGVLRVVHSKGNGAVSFAVKDTQKQKDAITHVGTVVNGDISINDEVLAKINESDRSSIAHNHSATHLLHAALRQILGDHVTQKGSLVDADRLRFDFSHFESITSEQLDAIEELVNEKIRNNMKVETQLMSHKDATASGAMALFGEKYGDVVRVLRIGDFSVELCGGTHVQRTGDIGLFKFTAETGVAAGVRRLEAVTGVGAIDWVKQTELSIQNLAAMLKSGREGIEERVAQLLQRNKDLEKQLEQLKSQIASARGGDLVNQAQEVEGIKVLAVRLDGADPKSLRDAVDQLKNKLGSCAVVLATVEENKVSLVAGVSKDQIKNIQAGKLVNFVAQQIGGKGGGRPDMAMAGGSQPAQLEGALNSVSEWVSMQLTTLPA